MGLSEKERIILGLDGCPTCEIVDDYLQKNPQKNTTFYEVIPGEPQSEKMLGLLEKVNIQVDEFPYCVDVKGKQIESCDVDPLIDTVQKWYDDL